MDVVGLARGKQQICALNLSIAKIRDMSSEYSKTVVGGSQEDLLLLVLFRAGPAQHCSLGLYCGLHRDYLSDTPIFYIAGLGVSV